MTRRATSGPRMTGMTTSVNDDLAQEAAAGFDFEVAAGLELGEFFLEELSIKLGIPHNPVRGQDTQDVALQDHSQKSVFARCLLDSKSKQLAA